jgi:hypothetical protein
MSLLISCREKAPSGGPPTLRAHGHGPQAHASSTPPARAPPSTKASPAQTGRQATPCLPALAAPHLAAPTQAPMGHAPARSSSRPGDMAGAEGRSHQPIGEGMWPPARAEAARRERTAPRHALQPGTAAALAARPGKYATHMMHGATVLPPDPERPASGTPAEGSPAPRPPTPGVTWWRPAVRLRLAHCFSRCAIPYCCMRHQCSPPPVLVASVPPKFNTQLSRATAAAPRAATTPAGRRPQAPRRRRLSASPTPAAGAGRQQLLPCSASVSGSTSSVNRRRRRKEAGFV